MSKHSSRQPPDDDPTLDFSQKKRQENPLPEIPGVTLGEEIARGGMGVVYRGVQDYLERPVAVKVLSSKLQGEDFNARFQREAKILAGIQHPHIVSCFAADVTGDGLCFMVMEYIDGPTLREWTGKNGPLGVGNAVLLCHDLARALRRAHENGIIHRDVKSENVLLELDPRLEGRHFPYRPKLVDLGLARTAGAADGLTAPGAVMGTPATMAPEQFDDPENVDYRADIYGLGCVFYLALTARRAFPSSPIGKVVAAKAAELGPDPRVFDKDVPANVALLVQRMMAHAREDRPQSYDEIIRACRAMAKADKGAAPPSSWFAPGEAPEPLPTPADTVPSADTTGRSGGRRLWWVAGAVTALAVLAWAWIPKNRTPPVNHPPVFDEVDREFHSRVGITTTLSAAATDEDGDELTFRWSQTAGDKVELSQENGVATFRPGEAQSGESLVFEVTVEDHGGEAVTAEVRGTVLPNARPAMNLRAWRVARDGEQENVALDLEATPAVPSVCEGDRLLLDAGASDDEPSQLNVVWTQTSGCRVPLRDAGLLELVLEHAIPTFEALGGPYLALSAEVSDGYHPPLRRDVVLAVEPIGDPWVGYDSENRLLHWTSAAAPSGQRFFFRGDDPLAVRGRMKSGEARCVRELADEAAAFCLTGAIELEEAPELPDAAGLRLELEDGSALSLSLEPRGGERQGVLRQLSAQAATTRIEPCLWEDRDWMAFHLAVSESDVEASWGSGQRWKNARATISSRPDRLVLFVRNGLAQFHDLRHGEVR